MVRQKPDRVVAAHAPMMKRIITSFPFIDNY
jgi:hypothetical protein